MKTILHVTLSANGSPSEVRARIADQVRASGTSSPEESGALAAARTFIDKSLEGVSEDDTLAVKAAISVSLVDAPAIVSTKITAAEDKAAATEKTLASVRAELEAAKGKLVETTAALEAATAAKAETPVGA